MRTAVIFNIQKFSVHDGPGIRTTLFFKGCPLTCQWCHNPESQKYGKDMVTHSDTCVLCGQCQNNCRQQAISIQNSNMLYNSNKCAYCEECIDHCRHNARGILGKEYTVDELMIEIEKDRPFYEQSGGGVTLSGGEVMTQIDFVEDLVKACKESGISVVVDTCGYAPRENFARIMQDIDVFLYDIKLMDSELHRQYTGVNNELILENLQLLSNNGATLNLRLPLIEGVNTGDSHIRDIIDFVGNLHFQLITLLPYHDWAKGKYERMNREYSRGNFAKPSDKRLEEIADMFKQANVRVTIGG